MKKIILIALIIIIVLISACTNYPNNAGTEEDNKSEIELNKFIGIIEKDSPKEYNPNGCGYCFTSEDGKFKCALLGKINAPGQLYSENLDDYLGKRVIIYGKIHEGAVLMMCPVKINVESIELID